MIFQNALKLDDATAMGHGDRSGHCLKSASAPATKWLRSSASPAVRVLAPKSTAHRHCDHGDFFARKKSRPKYPRRQCGGVGAFSVLNRKRRRPESYNAGASTGLCLCCVVIRATDCVRGLVYRGGRARSTYSSRTRSGLFRRGAGRDPGQMTTVQMRLLLANLELRLRDKTTSWSSPTTVSRTRGAHVKRGQALTLACLVPRPRRRRSYSFERQSVALHVKNRYASPPGIVDFCSSSHGAARIPRQARRGCALRRGSRNIWRFEYRISSDTAAVRISFSHSRGRRRRIATRPARTTPGERRPKTRRRRRGAALPALRHMPLF